MNTNLLLSFPIPENGGSYLVKRGDTSALALCAIDGTVTATVTYDYSEIPLSLSAKAAVGDTVSLILLSYRIELRINDRLADEEWPAGVRLYSPSLPAEGTLSVTVSDYVPVQKSFPTVLSSFENAQGWRPEETVFVGDCMPYVEDERYHVLYLKDRRHHKSKWKLGAHQWEHISTADFRTWNVHPTAVEITSPEEGSICTGSQIRYNGTDYLFYTVRMADFSPARICRSYAKDGYHFRKDPSFCFTLSEKYTGASARDPKIVLDDNGLFHMILTTSLSEEKRGCLAHLVSKDLNEWTELEAPIYISEDETEPECPDYIRYRGRYYLIFSLKSKAHYLYSERPFDGWKAPKDPIIPCSSVPKGAIWNDEIVFTGFERLGGYAGTMTFRTATTDDNGEFSFR